MQPAKSDQEPELDSYIERAIRVDPDVWVVEIDDRRAATSSPRPWKRAEGLTTLLNRAERPL